jgi:hypothetical protein
MKVRRKSSVERSESWTPLEDWEAVTFGLSIGDPKLSRQYMNGATTQVSKSIEIWQIA